MSAVTGLTSKLRCAFDSIYARLILLILAGFGVLAASNYATICEVQRLYVVEAELSRAQHIASYIILLEDAADRGAAVTRLNTAHFNGTVNETLAIFDERPDWGKVDPELERQVELLRTVLSEQGIPAPETFARMVDHGNPLFEIHLPSVEFAVKLADGKWLTVSSLLHVDDRLIVWVQRGFILIEALLVLALVLWQVKKLTRPMDELGEAAARFGKSPETAQAFPENGVREIRTTARSFNRMREQIQGNLLERNRMISAMAHDLRTPLTRLGLRLDRVDDEALKAKLQESVSDMKSIIEQGLAFAKSLDTSEAASRVDVVSLLTSMAEDFADVGSNVKASRELMARSLPLVLEVKPMCLKRCLENLVTNALRYAGSAEIQLTETPQTCTIVVADRGPGIPPELLEKVFEPYYRVEASRSRASGGTGLGLAIARNMANLNGGDLKLRNREGGGLEAVLTLPKA